MPHDWLAYLGLWVYKNGMRIVHRRLWSVALGGSSLQHQGCWVSPLGSVGSKKGASFSAKNLNFLFFLFAYLVSSCDLLWAMLAIVLNVLRRHVDEREREI